MPDLAGVLKNPFQSKIVRHSEEEIDSLLANPWNWRIHIKLQQEAVAAAIDEVGFWKSITVNEVTGHVVDGHLRFTILARSKVKTVPVEWVHLTEEEEVKALLSGDSTGGMAKTDRKLFEDAYRSIADFSPAFRLAMANILKFEGIKMTFAPPELKPPETLFELSISAPLDMAEKILAFLDQNKSIKWSRK